MVPPRRPETVMDAAATLASLVSKPSAASTTSNVEGDPTAAMAVTNKREQQETSPRQINGKLLSPPICQQKSDGPDQLSIRSNDVLQTFSSTSDLKSSGRIKKAPKFPAKVLPQHFKQAKFTSFLRKLYRWGFAKRTERETGDKDAATYFHPKFQRGNLDLCHSMSCSNKGLASQEFTKFASSGATGGRHRFFSQHGQPALMGDSAGNNFNSQHYPFGQHHGMPPHMHDAIYGGQRYPPAQYGFNNQMPHPGAVGNMSFPYHPNPYGGSSGGGQVVMGMTNNSLPKNNAMRTINQPALVGDEERNLREHPSMPPPQQPRGANATMMAAYQNGLGIDGAGPTPPMLYPQLNSQSSNMIPMMQGGHGNSRGSRMPILSAHQQEQTYANSSNNVANNSIDRMDPATYLGMNQHQGPYAPARARHSF